MLFEYDPWLLPELVSELHPHGQFFSQGRLLMLAVVLASN